jgi:hypothetical protein
MVYGDMELYLRYMTCYDETAIEDKQLRRLEEFALAFRQLRLSGQDIKLEWGEFLAACF